MEVDISQAKSRAFNIFLRFLQLATSLLIAILIAQLDLTSCNTTFYKLVLVVILILGAISLITLLYLRCVTAFPKIQFYILLSIELIASGIILVVSFAGFGQSNVCATNSVLFKFAVTEIILIVIMAIFILLSSFYWIQRYSNSPGNFAWTFLFLTVVRSDTYSNSIVLIGVLSLIVTLLSLTANIVAAIKKINICVKKTIVIFWATSLLLMLINQIIAIATFFKAGDTTEYNDMIDKKLLQIFMAVNIIELILWIFGLLTLKNQEGDKIRDTLLIFGQKDEVEEQQENDNQNQGKGFGTLK